MRPRWSLVILATSLAMLSACQRVTEADHKAAIDTVKANVAAMEKEDLEAVMGTIHPKSPNFGPTRDLVLSIQKAFQLSYDLEKVELDRASTNGILVRFVQVVRLVEGPDDTEFKDSRTTGTHLLQKDGKQWKIWSTQVQKSELLPSLDEAPIPSAPAATPKPAPTTPPAAAAAGQ